MEHVGIQIMRLSKKKHIAMFFLMILLMVQKSDEKTTWYVFETPVNNEIFTISTGAGSLKHQQYKPRKLPFWDNDIPFKQAPFLGGYTQENEHGIPNLMYTLYRPFPLRDIL